MYVTGEGPALPIMVYRNQNKKKVRYWGRASLTNNGIQKSEQKKSTLLGKGQPYQQWYTEKNPAIQYGVPASFPIFVPITRTLPTPFWRQKIVGFWRDKDCEDEGSMVIRRKLHGVISQNAVILICVIFIDSFRGSFSSRGNGCLCRVGWGVAYTFISVLSCPTCCPCGPAYIGLYWRQPLLVRNSAVLVKMIKPLNNSGNYMYRLINILKIFHFTHTVYLLVYCNSHNEKQFLP